ncbi:probable ubiquitin-like-specific protease 2B isoform X1 [Cucurbita pepo subsp. pepo]|uniref:probable ubiquitin-like-specific protease 2B isoform X1 n=1 Tax=Cucurbita pepo subsp. pepo TaxID=3664 RepID=UPI000C9DA531|nr:probable ubiquitin-like-specific protease 2B isoform X1 [Cucurbita pepo subsp. pepo]
MKNASVKGLEVFDFTEEDELPELISEKRLSKFKNPNLDTNAVLKYEFLECDKLTVANGFVVEGKEIKNPHMDVDLGKCNRGCDNGISHIPSGTTKEQFIMEEGKYQLDANTESELKSHSQDMFVQVDGHVTGSLGSELDKIGSSSQSPILGLNCTLPEFNAEREPIDALSDPNGSMNGNSSMSPPSETVEDGVLLNGKYLDNCSSDNEMDDLNKEVVLYPDYIVYGDFYCASPSLTFSPNAIKINGFADYGSNEFLNLEWRVDDLIDIECQCFQRVEYVMIKLHVISKDAGQCDNSCDTSGIKEVKIVLVDSYWSEKQQKIRSLDSRYMAIWNMSLDAGIGTDDDDLGGQRHYFPNFDEPFEEVVYPKGDPDAVSISKRDVDLLQPETFVNDTIIDFYIQYLKSQIDPQDKHRFHFFNSFFFRKLADLDKDPSSASDGRAAFLRVRKWTRKVDLFEKDYIFIPINFNLHWSLMVICHPGEVARYSDEDLTKSMKVPCILHMDSIKGSHAGLKNLIQSYLLEEWKERNKETPEDISTKFKNLRFLPLELPQQENSFDCGLFLLHYLELFLAEAPLNFSPFKIFKLSKFLNVDWFPPAEAYLKRTLIQRLIFEILENRSREMSTAACSDELLSKFPSNNEDETGVELLLERGSPAVACNHNLSSSQAVDGIEITLLSESSSRPNHFIDGSGLVVRELFEPGASNGSLLGDYQSFAQTSSYFDTNATVLEDDADAETGDRFMYLPPVQDGLQPIDAMASQACRFPCSSIGLESKASFDLCMSIQPERGRGIASSSAEDLEDVGIIESCKVREASPGNKEERNRKRPLSHEKENLEPVAERPTSAATTVQDVDTIVISQDTNMGSNDSEPPLCEDTLIASPCLDEATKTDVEHDDSPVVVSITEVNLDEEPPAKKPRHSPYPEETSKSVEEGLSDGADT